MEPDVGYVVGTDEAGYAPNLGPLVISATVWSVPGDPCNVDFYKLLHKVVAKTPATKTKKANKKAGPVAGTTGFLPRRLLLADSKVVYRPGEGLGNLELGVLAALALAGRRPTTWRELWEVLDEETAGSLDRLPWHVDFERNVPLEADERHVDHLAARLAAEAEAAGVKLLAVRSRAVFPDHWNALTDEHNKSTALSTLTLELISRVLGELPAAPVAVICDKHGGRNFYQSLLQQHVSYLVEVYGEGRKESIYRWGPDGGRTEVAFRVNAERYLPCAVASMTSKYLRELSMLAFNQYWNRHLPDLRPTAGYPLDAGRFKAEIAATQATLGIDDRILWRNR
jgi:ribonuclease HII